MTKYLLAALAAVAVALGGWGYYGHYRNLKLKETITTHELTIGNQAIAIRELHSKQKRDTAVLRDMAARSAALATKQKETDHALSKALAANSEWASTPIPPDVADWLRGEGTAPSTDPGPTADDLTP
jgi:hypothetical protein